MKQTKPKDNIFATLPISDAGLVTTPSCHKKKKETTNIQKTTTKVTTPVVSKPAGSGSAAPAISQEPTLRCNYCISYGHDDEHCLYKDPNYNPESYLKNGGVPPSRPCIICSKQGKKLYHASSICPDRCLVGCHHVHHYTECRVYCEYCGEPGHTSSQCAYDEASPEFFEPQPDPAPKSEPKPEVKAPPPVPVKPAAKPVEKVETKVQQANPKPTKAVPSVVPHSTEKPAYENVPIPPLPIIEQMLKIDECKLCHDRFGKHRSEDCPMRCKMGCPTVHHDMECTWYLDNPDRIKEIAARVRTIEEYFDLLFRMRHNPHVYYAHANVPAEVRLNLLRTIFSGNNETWEGSQIFNQFKRFVSLLPARVNGHLQRIYMTTLPPYEKAAWVDNMLCDNNPLECRYCPRCISNDWLKTQPSMSTS